MGERLSVLSYNILYPNTEGWWIYKYYDPTEPSEVSGWERRRSLLRQQLSLSQADIICLQETASSSFDDDFRPLNADYDRVIHAKGMRMRCATLWRSERLELIDEKHGYRSLLTLLRSRETDRMILVINVHLSGGPKPRERVEQLSQALIQGSKLFKRSTQGSDTLSEARVLLCGDFNMELAESQLELFLRRGALSSEAREANYPHTPLTKRGKHHPFAPLLDSAEALGVRAQEAPTLQVSNLIHRFCQPVSTGQSLMTLERDVMRAREESLEALITYLKPELFSAARIIFDRFADLLQDDTSSATRMSAEAAHRWIIEMNGALRGSELKALERALKTNGQSSLSFDEWVMILVEELRAGKWWSVAHDLLQSGAPLPPLNQGQPTLHRERLDHIVFGGALRPIAWCESPLFIHLRELPSLRDQPLPNRDHPSDHLPIQVTLELI